MNTYSKLALAATSVLCLSFQSNAQNVDQHDVTVTVDEVASLRVVDANASPSNGLTFNLTAPNTPGAAIDMVATQSLYLQYTSVRGTAPDNIRKITVDLVSGLLPNGVSLTLDPTVNGVGSCGNGVPVILSSSNSSGDIITDIESGYTGTASGDGSVIDYSLAYATANLDASASGDITLRYTLSNL